MAIPSAHNTSRIIQIVQSISFAPSRCVNAREGPKLQVELLGALYQSGALSGRGVSLAQCAESALHTAVAAFRTSGGGELPAQRRRTGRSLGLPVKCFSKNLVAAVRQLQYDSDRKSDARIPAVVKVVPVVIIDVNVIVSVPIFVPVFRPGIHEQEREAAVREARIPHVHRGAAVHPEPVLTPEIEAEAVLRNVVTAIASTLRPGAMLAVPPSSTTLLPGPVSLPAALP